MIHDLIAAIDRVGLEKIFLLLMAPVFVACMTAEYFWLRAQQRQTYSLHETATNVPLA